MGASGYSYLNYMECLLHRSPSTPGMFPPPLVFQSFDQPHFEVLPHAPHVLFGMTSTLDRQVRQGTWSSPCRTADYNLALGCHLPFFRVLICYGARGNVTYVHVVASYGFTVVGEPQEELSPVHHLLLTSKVILHYIGGYPIRHMGHHCMQTATPPVLELPLLSSKGI